MNNNRKGAIGALLAEYEKAINELQVVIKDITQADLITVVDNLTTNPDCKSIQTLLTHIVSSGYSYGIYIQEMKTASDKQRKKISRTSVNEYITDLDDILHFTEDIFSNIQDDELEEFDDSKKIKTSWEQVYDIEQLMEHAIVHILRHRRQIEQFKLILKNQTIYEQ